MNFLALILLLYLKVPFEWWRMVVTVFSYLISIQGYYSFSNLSTDVISCAKVCKKNWKWNISMRFEQMKWNFAQVFSAVTPQAVQSYPVLLIYYVISLLLPKAAHYS
jgi:hypothetical protein